MSNPIMIIKDKNSDRKAEQSQLATDRFENMIQQQMNGQTGRAFVAYVLDKLGHGQNITDTNASVYGKTAKQAVSNDISRDIKRVCPELFMKMEGEVTRVT